MRILFPLLSLALAGLSVMHVCPRGFCRFDQIYAAIDAEGMNPANVSALLNQDASNPMVWCTLGELLSIRGDVDHAAAAFEHAIAEGPGMSPVLMRAANFDFPHGRVAHGLLMTNRILSETDAFDQILFSYLTRSGVATQELLGVAIPMSPRPARAWLAWLRSNGTDQDLLITWAWMRRNGLSDSKSAADLALTLWARKSFRTAQDMWADWIAIPGYLHPQRLANTRFETEPNGSPFDWTLTAPPSVELSRGDGLSVRFSGTANIDFAQVHQFTTVSHGRYRFSAEIEAMDLTTDQGPFFHIFDIGNASRMSVASEQIKGDVRRTWITVDFEAPPGVEAIVVQLERRPSQRFDNKISGALHIYQVSLVPVS